MGNRYIIDANYTGWWYSAPPGCTLVFCESGGRGRDHPGIPHDCLYYWPGGQVRER